MYSCDFEMKWTLFSDHLEIKSKSWKSFVWSSEFEPPKIKSEKVSEILEKTWTWVTVYCQITFILDEKKDTSTREMLLVGQKKSNSIEARVVLHDTFRGFIWNLHRKTFALIWKMFNFEARSRSVIYSL